MRYLVAIHKDDDSCYGATIPDLPGAFSSGDTLEECIANASEAASLWLDVATEQGHPIPDAHPPDVWFGDADLADAVFWVYVEPAGRERVQTVGRQ